MFLSWRHVRCTKAPEVQRAKMYLGTRNPGRLAKWKVRETGIVVKDTDKSMRLNF